MRPETEISDASDGINLREGVDFPTQLLTPEISVAAGTTSPTTFRNLVKEVSRVDISSVQAANFLEIFGEELEGYIVKARRAFIEKHFGNKNSNQ